MTEALLAALGLGEQALTVGIAVFLRVGAAIAVLPAFGEQSLSMRVRVGAALAFTALVAPGVADAVPPIGWAGFMRLAGTETVIGLAFGLILRLMIVALQIAGTVAAQSTSLAQIFGGAAAEPMPAIGHLLVVSGLALAAMADFHVHIVAALIGTYQFLPPGSLPAPGDLAELGIAHVARAFGLGFSIAAPFLIGALVYNLALGAINRAMPQLMVAFVGAPAITAAGLALLALVAPTALEVWLGALQATLARPFGTP